MSVIASVKGERGYCILKQTGGVSGGDFLTNGNEVLIPTITQDPVDPLNIAYQPMVNTSMYLSNATQGGETPSFTLTTMLKSSWVTYRLFNSLLRAFDANNDGNVFSILSDDGGGGTLGGYGHRIMDGATCIAASFSRNAPAGGVQLDLGFVGLGMTGPDWGYSSSTTFATSVNVDPGYLIGKRNIDFGSSPTANGVQSWALNVLRGGAPQFYEDGLDQANHIGSGMVGGNFTLNQTDKATVTPSTGVTIRLGVGLGAGAGTCLTIALAMNLDSTRLPISANILSRGRAYTLADLVSGGPVIAFT